MADNKLSDLPAANALADSDLFYVVQSPGVSQAKATGAQLKVYAGGGSTTTAAYSVLGNNTGTAMPATSNQSIIIGAPPFAASGAAAQVTGSINGTYQYEIQNTSSAALASTDFVATADTGNDTTQYVNIGINGSGFSNAAWTINGPLDSYLYSSDGELAVGTAAVKAVDFFTGGLLAANRRMTVGSAGGVEIVSNLSTAFIVGANGATNPALQIDTSVASVATGLKLTPAIAGGGYAISTISPNANEALSIATKGAGNFAILIGPNTRYSLAAGVLHAFTVGQNSFAANVRFGYVGAADVGLNASTEAPSVYFNSGQTRQHSAGALTLQRDFRVTGSTHSFVGASVLTDAAAFSVDGPGSAGTNATIVNSHGIYMPVTAVAGTVNNAYGLTINAPTGATNNYAARLNGEVNMTAAIRNATTAKTAAFTADNAGHTYECDSTTAAFAATLPAASTCSGRKYIFKKTDNSANAITVTRAGTDLIDGQTTYPLNTQYKYVVLQANAGGTGWNVIGNN